MTGEVQAFSVEEEVIHATSMNGVSLAVDSYFEVEAFVRAPSRPDALRALRAKIDQELAQ